jgi:serine/threonine/tyrosine protein kinase RAD53
MFRRNGARLATRVQPRLGLAATHRCFCSAARRHYARAVASTALPLGAALAIGSSLLASGGQTEAASSSEAGAVPGTIVGRRVQDDYDLGETLGEGAFAVVRRGVSKRTGKKVAIKVIPTTLQSSARVRAEVAVLQRVSLHTCIAKFEAMYEHIDEGKFYIVMEFVDGGDLLDAVNAHGRWSEANAARLLSEVGGAIALLHAQGLCHADVKPENVLLTGPRRGGRTSLRTIP